MRIKKSTWVKVQLFQSGLLALCILIFFLLSALVAFGGTVKQDIVTPYVEVRQVENETCGSGTVVWVGDEKLILTAGHVVAELKDGDKWKPAYLYQERGAEKFSQEAYVVAYSPTEDQKGHDLALLKPSAPDRLTATKLGLDLPMEEGDEAWYCGTGAGIHQSLEKTIVARTSYRIPELDNSFFFMINGCAWYGHSGSGVFLKHGEDGVTDYRLAGVIVRVANRNDPKTPALCQTQETIKAFVDSYLESKNPKESK